MNIRGLHRAPQLVRWIIRIMLASGIVVCVTGLFPPLFEITDCHESHKTFTNAGQVVVRYGLSRIRAEGTADGRKDGIEFGGPSSAGRCFVDYEVNGVPTRRYGWHLSVRNHFVRAPLRVKYVIVDCR